MDKNFWTSFNESRISRKYSHRFVSNKADINAAIKVGLTPSTKNIFFSLVKAL